MKNILIMGGTSFVSSSLARHLINQGYKVDILTRGNQSLNYSGINKHIFCDRKSSEQMKEKLKDSSYDVIFDISAYTRYDVETLLSSIDIKAVQKYIFCSSGAVHIPSEDVCSEEFPRGENPNWGQYGLDKMEAEDYLFTLSEAEGFPVIIFRPTYIYGQENNLYREAYFFDRIQQGKAIPIPCGNNTRTQFIHIDDLVRSFESAITNSNSGKAYNLTHPEQVDWQTLVEICGKVMGIEARISNVDVHKTKVESRSYFPFRDVNYSLDISSLVSSGMHVPSVSLVEGLKKTYDWYLSARPKLSDERMSQVEIILESGGRNL